MSGRGNIFRRKNNLKNAKYCCWNKFSEISCI